MTDRDLQPKTEKSIYEDFIREDQAEIKELQEKIKHFRKEYASDVFNKKNIFSDTSMDVIDGLNQAIKELEDRITYYKQKIKEIKND
jgi:DUF438 domain-containing protein